MNWCFDKRVFVLDWLLFDISLSRMFLSQKVASTTKISVKPTFRCLWVWNLFWRCYYLKIGNRRFSHFCSNKCRWGERAKWSGWRQRWQLLTILEKRDLRGKMIEKRDELNDRLVCARKPNLIPIMASSGTVQFGHLFSHTWTCIHWCQLYFRTLFG